jgi:hypothetical protein
MSKVIKPKNIFQKLASELVLYLLVVFILWIFFIKLMIVAEIIITFILVSLAIYFMYSFVRKLFNKKQ